jgi:hypothetical protein
MTERLFLYTAFAGTTLHNGTTIKQIAPYEVDGPRAVTRLFTLSNGVVFDADGTADGTTTYGTIRATMRITGANQAAANATLATIQGLLNKSGTLTGTEYGASSGATDTCTARLIVARPILRADMSMAAGKTYQIEVELVWQRKSAWA